MEGGKLERRKDRMTEGVGLGGPTGTAGSSSFPFSSFQLSIFPSSPLPGQIDSPPWRKYGTPNHFRSL